MIELKPCPFCGSTELDFQISTEDREGIPTNVICMDCSACGPSEYSEPGDHSKAIQAWNTRSGESLEKKDAHS